MKQTLLILISIAAFASCSKKDNDDAPPDYAKEISGEYKGIYMMNGGSRVTLGTIAKWDVTITYTGYNAVGITSKSQVSSNPPSYNTIPGVQVTKEGGTYHMHSLVKTAEYDGDTLTLFISHPNDYVKAVRN